MEIMGQKIAQIRNCAFEIIIECFVFQRPLGHLSKRPTKKNASTLVWSNLCAEIFSYSLRSSYLFGLHQQMAVQTKVISTTTAKKLRS